MSRAEEIRTLALVLVVTLIPVVGVGVGIATTSQLDLSDLVPIAGAETDTPLLRWSSLLREDDAGTAGARADIRTGMQVRVLGYMAEGERPASGGEWVREFYLLPDAGSLFHPAHRHTDQMIAVHLLDAARVRFSSKELTWVWGSLELLPDDAADEKPLYALHGAHAQPADKKDILRYFR